MSRIRTIKPEIASDIGLSRLSIPARYTFILLITQADDYGLLAGTQRQLLGALYPHDDAVTDDDLASWIDELAGAGFVRRRHTVDGAPVLQITSWEKHQRIDNASRSVLHDSLAPEDGSAQVCGDSPRVAAKIRSRARDLGPRTIGPRSKDLGKQPTPQSADADRWRALEDEVRTAYGGKATRNRKTGERLSWVGNIIRVAGAKAGDDPLVAVEIWREWWTSLEPRFRPQPIAAADRLATWERRNGNGSAVAF